MSQRASGYERKQNDLYETPEWVTHALIDGHLRAPKSVWEPACGSGKIVAALGALDCKISGTDYTNGEDFLSYFSAGDHDTIITNPPYKMSAVFIAHSLELMKPNDGQVAMLLRTDFDHAKTRAYLFGDCPQFKKKLVLTKRIKWFEDSTGSPSFNHAWFIWDWTHKGPPTIAYGPRT